MNQILSTSMPTNNNKKSKSSQPIAIGSILKFFAIAMSIFGILLVGVGGYSIYKGQSNQ